ncbi:GlxA family transcriptional regulator [Plantactinospora sp. GCM10030261]|uniref:GlxA family transcriptional regulator n=1 Tax=Plantactinospora sp. GCM10030261 TaxID=3273420 RepID=UPI00361407C1
MTHPPEQATAAAPAHRVAALVNPPVSPFELACAGEVFGLSRPGLPARYEFVVCTPEPGPVPTLLGYDLVVPEGLAALGSADTIVIPGWQAPEVPPRVLDALKQAHGRGVRILAICYAAFVLAEAGLLAGRRATTHWLRAAELAARYPDIEVVPDILYVDHGDVATTAGSAAGADLCLHVVRKDHGAAHAAEIARYMVMPPRREGGQAQYARVPPVPAVEQNLSTLLEWALGRLDKPMSVAELARRAKVSERSLTRHFQEQLGTSPGQWLLHQRVDAARQLLELTDLPVETVAARVGFSSALNLRRRFQARVGTTPAAYRRVFARLPPP